jgi:WD40 repeat protein
MTNIKTLILGLFLFLVAQSKASSNIFNISPDGKTIAFSSQNFVIYLLDATTLSVTKKVRLKSNPITTFDGLFCFSPDGKTFLYSTSTDIIIFNTNDWSVKQEIKRFKGDIYWSGDYSNFLLYDYKTISIYDMNSAKIEDTIITQTENRDIQNVSFSSDNSKLILISNEYNSTTEPKERYTNKDYQSLNQKEHFEKEMKNDGRQIVYTVINIEDSNVEKIKNTWFSNIKLEVIPLPNNEFILGSTRGFLKIDSKDKITVYNEIGGSNYKYDALNNLLIYTSFSKLNVFDFKNKKEYELRNEYVTTASNCLINNSIYYVIFAEYCIGSCTKDGGIVSPIPIY